MLRNRTTFYWIFAGLAVALTACWVFNLAYYRAGQLEKPVFLTHHIEAENREGAILHLYALQNRQEDDPGRIVEVSLPGLEQAEVSVSWSDTYRNQELVQYAVRLERESAGDIRFGAWAEDDKPIKFDTVEVRHLDGSRSTEPIGELYVYPYTEATEALSVPETRGSGERSGQTTIRAETDLRVTGVDRAAQAAGDGQLQLYWSTGSAARQPAASEGASANGVPLEQAKFPAVLRTGEQAVLSYARLERGDEDWATVYSIMPRVEIEMEAQAGTRIGPGTSESAGTESATETASGVGPGTSGSLPLFTEIMPRPDERQVRQFVLARRDRP
ncbi:MULTISPECIES: hypothetical protein [Saccharibacillus]|uniref:hypothetical protein n=1 Tax=Saccharibacillus TaxID=456492 RepID=UPI001239FED6|nr:hypothetical protein [Saccharibacillus sp. WB 17]MWJ31940.1 hypothetical protein [Saccharibacillus sp. WB 17]